MDNTPEQFFTDIFKCDSCTQAIAPADPRIRCLICRNYDLCANCAIGERFTGEHLASHQTQVYKESGGIAGHLPVLSRNMIMYTGTPSPPGRSTRYSSGHDPHQGNTPHPNAAYPANTRGPPPLPTRPRPEVRASNNPPIAENQWQPFFFADMNPTPTFVTLCNDIFTYLDSSNSGFLTPETYSRFLDDQGYLPNENVCAS
jgi:Zinc finger, ZZ type